VQIWFQSLRFKFNLCRYTQLAAFWVDGGKVVGAMLESGSNEVRGGGTAVAYSVQPERLKGAWFR
jgi:hypothetical protein